MLKYVLSILLFLQISIYASDVNKAVLRIQTHYDNVTAHGSAILVAPNMVITCYHCLTTSQSQTTSDIHVMTTDNKETTAKAIWGDKEMDIAVLQLDNPEIVKDVEPLKPSIPLIGRITSISYPRASHDPKTVISYNNNEYRHIVKLIEDETGVVDIGSSGGAVLDKDKLIGMIIVKTSYTKSTTTSTKIMTGYGFIPCDRFPKHILDMLNWSLPERQSDILPERK